MEKMTKRKMQAIQSRQHILETALELTKQKGFEKISIQDICGAAGVSTGAFYHYFKSKDDIVLDWYDIFDDYFRDTVIPNLKEGSCLERIIQYMEQQVLYVERTGVQYIIQLYRAQLAVENHRFFSEERVFPMGLKVLIEEGQEKGELASDIPAEEIRDGVLTISRGIIFNWCLRDGKGELVRYMKDIIKRYLGSYSGLRERTFGQQ